jgi:hypothetical protein
MRSAVACLAFAVSLASCSSGPTIDQRLLPNPREYPRRKGLVGVRDTRFDTTSAMYASAELVRSIAPLTAIATKPEFQKIKTKEWEDAVAFQALWMARYNVETLDWVSGMGIPLADGDARIAALLSAAGLQSPPIRNPLPIAVPFLDGDPHFTMTVDLGDPNTGVPPNAATMRFDPKRMNRTVGPESIAMALWAELELARHLLASAPSGEDKEAAASAKAHEDVFEGLLLLNLASEKARVLRERLMRPGVFEPFESSKSWLFGSWFAESPKSTYFPHRFAVTDSTSSSSFGVIVDDPVSYLGDLVAVLFAASELADVSAATPQNPLARYFAAGGPLPPGTHDGAVALAKAALHAILTIHDTPEEIAPASYVSAEERGTTLLTNDVSLLLVALQSYERNVEPLSSRADALMRKMASWLVEVQYDDGTYTQAYDTTTFDATERRWFAAATQGIAIRGLLVAFEESGDFTFRRAAVRAQREADDTQWLIDKKLYRSEDLISSGMAFSRYTPTIVGAVTAALRELTLTTRDPAYAERYAEFVSGMSIPAGVFHSGLLLSELAATGEKAPDARDGDTDGVLNAPFADGPFGVAPVFAREVVISTP